METLVVFSGLSEVTNISSSGPKKIVVDNRLGWLLLLQFLQHQSKVYADFYVNTISDNVSVGSSVVIGIGSTSFENVEVLEIFPIQSNPCTSFLDLLHTMFAPVGSSEVISNYFDVAS